jgi:hypothetical protein
MKKTYRILQLERLGKKLNKWIISELTKFEDSSIEIYSCIYGPTAIENCKSKIKKLRKIGKC